MNHRTVWVREQIVASLRRYPHSTTKEVTENVDGGRREIFYTTVYNNLVALTRIGEVIKHEQRVHGVKIITWTAADEKVPVSELEEMLKR